MVRWRNWAGDQTCRPFHRAVPPDTAAVAEAVRWAGEQGLTVRVAGSGHSFGDLVPTDGLLISPQRLSGIRSVRLTERSAGGTSIDPERSAGGTSLDPERSAGGTSIASGAEVVVGAGTVLAELNRLLDGHDLAMPNLGDIDAQTVGGAIATATHGTGLAFGNLATRVTSLELVTADGAVHMLTGDDPETLAAARVSLGALGVVTAVGLDVVPAFRLRARDRPMPLAEALFRLDELAGSHDHVEFHLFPHTATALMRINDRTDAPAAPQGRLSRYVDETLVQNRALDLSCRAGRAAPAVIPPLNRAAVAALRPVERTDRSHRVFCTRRTVRFTETEWAMPRAAAHDAVRAIHLAGSRHDVNLPIEVRFAAADTDAFLSPAWDRDTVYVAAHMYRGMAWEPYFRAVGDIARSFGGRPHWGKRHLLDAADLAPLYPAWGRFAAVRDRLDPERRFTNPHITRVLG